jgi:SAM-dependent methyltransferase
VSAGIYSETTALDLPSESFTMRDWVAFYDSAHSIYVNARHRDVHYARLAEEIARHAPSPSAAVLDYGCGEAIHADRVAAGAGRLMLAEAAQSVRARLIERFKGNPRITVISTDRAAVLPEGSFDVLVMHSVSQYLTREAFDGTVALFHRLLKPGGLFLLGDVIQPNVGALSDAWALIRFGWNDGFLFAAIHGLIRTFFSEYWRLRTRLGLSRYAEAEMIAKLAAAGFAAKRAPRNLGHLETRMTFLARKIAEPQQGKVAN